GQLERLLEGFATEPNRNIWELPVLSQAERDQLLVEWNPAEAEPPNEQCIHELFAGQAARSPQAIALTHEDRQISYRELELRSNQLAHYLRGLGVAPEVVVGLCVERSIEMMIGLLGILKAGGAYLPLDPGYPAERLAYMLEDSQASLIVTQDRL